MKPYFDFMHPYLDDVWRRLFLAGLESSELKWHKDLRDRRVEVLGGNGWGFQFDNELPFSLRPGLKFKVPKLVYHRLLLGKTNLMIRIDETPQRRIQNV